MAEDNIFNQAVAVEVLKKLGCDVEVASNGRAAVEAFEARQFDIILMDLQMPEMDGYEATRILRSKETATRIPIIAQTAHAFAEDRRRCMEVGMDDFVSKPIAMSELLRTLARFSPSRKLNERLSGSQSRSDGKALTETFDPSGLLARVGGDTEAFQDLSQLFFQSVSLQIAALHSALEEKNCAEIAKSCHSIKGACANFGAKLMEGIALEMELAAKAGEFGQMTGLADKLETEFAKIGEVVEVQT